MPLWVQICKQIQEELQYYVYVAVEFLGGTI